MAEAFSDVIELAAMRCLQPREAGRNGGLRCRPMAGPLPLSGCSDFPAGRRVGNRVGRGCRAGRLAVFLLLLTQGLGPASLLAAQELKPRASSDSYFAQARNQAPVEPKQTNSGLTSRTAAGNERPVVTTKDAPDAAVAVRTSPLSASNSPPASDLPPASNLPLAGNSPPAGNSPLAGEAFQPGQVVALVGGEPIFVADMMLEINQILDKYMPGAPPEVRQREQGNVVRALVNKYVEQRLMAVDTKRNLPEKVTWEGITEQAEKDFDKKALPLLMEKSGAKSPAEYDANLRAMGSSLRKMRANWSEEQIIRYFINQKVQTQPTVTRDEMLAEYEANREEYFRPARCRWEELMIRFDRCPQRPEAQAQIVELGNQVVYGASFAAVAEKSSHGFTAHRGGIYDWTTKGSLVNKSVDGAIFSLPLNELSEIIESDLGLHIVRVLEREDERYLPFVEVQSEIKEKLVNKKREASFQQHVAKLRELIPVEYLVEPLRK